MRIKSTVKLIINNLYEAKVVYEKWQITGIAETINQNISNYLQKNLRKAKLESFYQEYINLCISKGFDELL